MSSDCKRISFHKSLQANEKGKWSNKGNYTIASLCSVVLLANLDSLRRLHCFHLSNERCRRGMVLLPWIFSVLFSWQHHHLAFIHIGIHKVFLHPASRQSEPVWKAGGETVLSSVERPVSVVCGSLGILERFRAGLNVFHQQMPWKVPQRILD